MKIYFQFVVESPSKVHTCNDLQTYIYCNKWTAGRRIEMLVGNEVNALFLNKVVSYLDKIQLVQETDSFSSNMEKTKGESY